MEQDGLLKPEVKKALEEIIGKCFANNRDADRIVSILNVFYCMPHASKELHSRIAHAYLNIHGADGIGEYMESRNATVIYLTTPSGQKEYSNAVECFEVLLQNQLDLEKIVQQAIIIASNNGDLTTKAFLDKFLVDLIPYTNVILTLVDKAHQYDISDTLNCASFDNHIGTFGLDALEEF